MLTRLLITISSGLKTTRYHVVYVVEHSETLFGEWRAGHNAGGQVSNRETFGTNPQVVFDVPDHGGKGTLVFHVVYKLLNIFIHVYEEKQ